MRYAFVASLAIVAVACAKDMKPATQVLVSVTAEGGARNADTVRVRLLGGNGARLSQRQVVDLKVPSGGWPIEFALDPADGDVTRMWRVEAWALARGQQTGAGFVQGGFVAGQLIKKTLVLKPGIDLGAVPTLTEDGGVVGSADGGSVAGDAGISAIDSAVDGSVPRDPCATNHGACDPLTKCLSTGSKVSCGDCPAGYDNVRGDGTLCQDINECATNNGGCGSAAYYSCTNNAGAPATCKDINECAGTNVCTADYPCQNLSPGYSCRGQFEDWPPAYSASAFAVSSNGTVTDSRSGLLWQSTLPATYAGCSGTLSVSGDACTWAEATAYCAGLSLAGTGWRLPTKAELESIIDDTRYNPVIDPTVFPSTPPGHFWSSSPYVGSSDTAWLVTFGIISTGDTGSCPTNCFDRVRCVKSNTAAVAASGSGGAPPARYTFPASGTVHDTRTALTWQRAVDAGSYTWANAKTYCTSLSLAGTGWRLPTRAELLTLVDPTHFHPAIDARAFPSTPTEWFWSASPYVGSSGAAWYIDFNTGYSSYIDANSAHRVWCVR